jgi:SprA family protein
MLLQSRTRIPYQPIASLDPVAVRRESRGDKQSLARASGPSKGATGGDQAVVVEFGALALDLARNEETLPGSTADAAGASEAASGATRAASEATANGAAAAVFASAAALKRAAPSVVSSGEPASDDASDEDSPSVKGTVFAADQLSESDAKQVTELRRRDHEVHTHEQAHKSSGGSYTGSIHLSYQMGPDGKRYAVEGSVPIDVSPIAGDPAATLRKMEVVHRAATAPASPSSADRQVAAQAQRVTQQARSQIAAERYSRARDLLAPA